MFGFWKLGPITFVAVSFFALSAPALGQFVSGSDGSDGALTQEVFETQVVIDLEKAVPGDWFTTPGGDQDGDMRGDGVYDAGVWAVVFKYSTIDVRNDVTITFLNHPSGAPVVWLATGDVTIDGTISVNGGNGASSVVTPPGFSEPGPGGWKGAQRGYGSPTLLSSPGFGPGGAPRATSSFGAGGGHMDFGQAGSGAPGGLPYGNLFISPLLGGSGGSAHSTSGGGAAGGGALLIASSTQIIFEGTITANGGAGGSNNGGGGAGGALRLIANTLSGAGELQARGGGGNGTSAGDGAIGWTRVEATTNNLTDNGNPPWVFSTPGPVFPPASAPTITLVSIDGVTPNVPGDPLAGILTTDLTINNAAAVSVLVQTTGIPPDPGTTVTVTAKPYRGADIVETSMALAGTCAASSVSVPITLPPGRVEIQVKAEWISICP